MSTPTCIPSLTEHERNTVEEAIQQLQDVAVWGTADASLAGLEGIDALDQIEETREAVSEAMKIITTFRRRVRRSSP